MAQVAGLGFDAERAKRELDFLKGERTRQQNIGLENEALLKKIAELEGAIGAEAQNVEPEPEPEEVKRGDRSRRRVGSEANLIEDAIGWLTTSGWGESSNPDTRRRQRHRTELDEDQYGTFDLGATYPEPDNGFIGPPEIFGPPEAPVLDVDGPPEAPVLDVYGTPKDQDTDLDNETRVINDLVQGDTARGGSAFRGWEEGAKHDVGRVTPVSEEGLGGGFRKKLGGWLGQDSEEGMQRFGAGLTGFGSGLLTGGSDFGAAMGHGFAKAQDQFVATKNSQRNASLDDHKMAMEDERMDWKREEVDRARVEAARARRMGSLSDLLTEDEARKKGVFVNDEGLWEIDPNQVRAADIPDEVRDLHSADQYLKTGGAHLLLEGETPAMGARRIMKIKVEDDPLLALGV